MKRLVTTEEMRKIEITSHDFGVSDAQLMENAGCAGAQFICSKGKVAQKLCVVLAGKGNNGGDAFVLARKLIEQNADVRIVLADGLPASELAKDNLNKVLAMGAQVLTYESGEQTKALLAQADLIVDGIFGTGFRGEIPAMLKELFAQINQSSGVVFSLDLPSGTNAQNGLADESAVAADFTLCFHAKKAGLCYYPAKKKLGETVVLPIGIAPKADEKTARSGFEIEREDIFSLLKPREPDSNKGDFGHLLTVCGSEGMIGAAILSAKGAARVGTGLLTVCIPAQNANALHISLPEAMALPIKTKDKSLSEENLEEILKALAKKTAILAGCGLRTGEVQDKILTALIQTSRVPLVLDADGINSLCGRIDILKQAKAPILLTPHMGEMARLLQIDTDQLRQNRIPLLKAFCSQQNVYVVLKDSVTTVFAPGGMYFVGSTGNAGLAKGGSGDLLAGMIAGFCAQGIHPLKSAISAVYLHGLSADRCAKRLSKYAMQPSDILFDLAEIFAENGL